MFLRRAGEARIFSDGQKSVSTAVPTTHPRWQHGFYGTLSNRQPHPLKKHIPLLPFLVSAAVVLLTISGGVAFAKNRIMPGISVNSVQLGSKSKADAVKLLNASIASQKVHIVVDGKQQNVKPADVGLNYDVVATVDKAFSANRSLASFYKNRRLEAVVSIDDTKLQKYLDSTVNKTKTPSQNAKLETDNGKVVITPEVKGQSFGIDARLAKQQLVQAASRGSDMNLTAQTFESSPTITTASLTGAKQKIEKLLATPVSLSVGDRTVVPTPTIIGTWLLFTPNEAQHTVDAKADPVRVSGYMDSIAKQFVNPPRARVVVKNDDGSTRTLSEGAPGTDITDKKTIAGELAAALNNNQAYSKSLPVSYASQPTITAQDWPKWIDVDLTNHRMYAYRQGEVERTFLISAGAARTPTVKGQFAVKTKVPIQNMRGFNADGTTYFQPNVQYINYFYQDYAIHGNYWRPSSVFGNVNTSHGCVGITNSDAKWMYDWAAVGTPIIIHS